MDVLQFLCGECLIRVYCIIICMNDSTIDVIHCTLCRLLCKYRIAGGGKLGLLKYFKNLNLEGLLKLAL